MGARFVVLGLVLRGSRPYRGLSESLVGARFVVLGLARPSYGRSYEYLTKAPMLSQASATDGSWPA